jgi:hypothetical protein
MSRPEDTDHLQATQDADRPERSELRLSEPLGPSLLFIYFMIGFVLGAVVTMVGLSLSRGALPSPAEVAWVRYLVFAPLVIGGLLGGRAARYGARERLPLSQALRRALWL